MQERAKFWHINELGGNFEALHATYFTHTFARHTHESYSVGVIERGAETFHYRGSFYTAGAGSIFIINPGEMHTGEALNVDGWTYRALYPEASLFQRAAAEIAGHSWDIPYFPSPIIYDPPLFEEMRCLHIALENTPSKLERETRLLRTIGQLILRHADDRPTEQHLTSDRQAVERARTYLHAHFAENISLVTLASVAYLSPYHLARLFHERFGLPPHVYLTQVRILHAKRLLRDGLALADVALETGFAHQSHLTRSFKRIVGVTPGQYSKNVQDR